MRTFVQSAISGNNRTAGSFRNRLQTNAEKLFALLSKPFDPLNSLNAVSAYLSGKHGYFYEGNHFHIFMKSLSLVGIYLLIPRSR